MNNNISNLTEIMSQTEELQDKIIEYKRLLNENFQINRKGFEVDFIDKNIEELAKLKEEFTEMISFERDAN